MNKRSIKGVANDKPKASGRNIMKHNIPAPLVLLALGLTLCGGCANMTYSYYDGPRQPKEEVGMIKAGVVSSIGGKDISYLRGHKIEVLPGSHSLGLSGTARSDSGEEFVFQCSLEVAVEAGHIYEGFISRGTPGGGETDVAVVSDRTTDKVVARFQPQVDDLTPYLVQLPATLPMRLTCDQSARETSSYPAASF